MSRKNGVPPDEALLTPRDLRRRLRLSYANVLALLHDGTLPSYDVGRGEVPRYRVREADLQAFLERRAQR